MRDRWFYVVPLMLAWLLSFGSAVAQGEEQTALSEEERAEIAEIYFDRCAGCHGVLRKGATGPSLEPENTRQRGIPYLEAVIFGGLPGGMPDWGRQGVLSEDEISQMARFLTEAPPEPPQQSLEGILETWTVHVPPEERPTEPQHDLDWENFFGVILRDMGQVAIVDGATRELVQLVDTGYAIHILRASKDGRYFTAIGRDGKASLIDLWSSPPAVVAEVKPCFDARSIESSKYEGYENEYAIVGCYWPPMFAVLDGLTLEPLKLVSTMGYERGAGDFVEEARVAAIVASEEHPEWVVNVKETGQTWLVDYSTLDQNGRPMAVTMIDTELYLHDGGWARDRYFIVAANAMDKLIVIDTREREVTAEIEAGVTPHPGRGANWDHPELGPLWATGNMGSPEMTVIGADPEGHPENAWEVQASVELPFTGTLFNKTHENSPWIIVDFTMSMNPEGAATLCAIGKESLEAERCWEVPGAQDIGARMVHIEFDRGGQAFWVSAWADMETPSFIAVYDAETLEEIDRIEGDWVRTPTGKFNVFNTAHDVY
ncbi:MAG: cytochrome D1 domain-containing protein [Trueperaceae bacterium]|nr:cytochrome D1 domain-containing protein [Trueperaceae bacterium]